MRYSTNLCRLAFTIVTSTIFTGFFAISSVKAYTLNWTRSTLDPTDPDYIEWDSSPPGIDTTNIYEFDPDYTAEVGPLFVKLTVSTNPTGHEVSRQGFGRTPGIYPGDSVQAGAGGFTDELFVFTKDKNPNAPDTITLTLEFFTDVAGTQPTNVEKFNTTFTDLDAGNNGQSQEKIIVSGEDISGTNIIPTFDVPTNSLVTLPPDTSSNNEVIGFTTGITDERGNVRAFFSDDVHKVAIDFIVVAGSNRDRNMFMTDLAITPDLAPLEEVPFEFSPTIGILLSTGILGINYLQKKYC